MVKNFIRNNIGFIVFVFVFAGAVVYLKTTGASTNDFYNYENIQRAGFMGFAGVNTFLNALTSIGNILEFLFAIFTEYLQPLFNMLYNIFEFIINAVMSVFDFIAGVFEKLGNFLS